MSSCFVAFFLHNVAAVVFAGRGACLPSLAADKKASVVVVAAAAVHGNTRFLHHPPNSFSAGQQRSRRNGVPIFLDRVVASRGWDEGPAQPTALRVGS
uniref:Putative secreted protein n=1 Tax=Ixodes ricinus TaxID=34613 RepID=A0A6B0UE84_IXORI